MCRPWTLLAVFVAFAWPGIAAAAPDAVWRLYNGRDHFYTTSCAEADAAVRTGYRIEVRAFFVEDEPVAGMVSLYRFYNGRDHFYTTDGNAEGASGYRREGALGYISPEPREGWLPLFRARERRTGNHFYTADQAELQAALRATYADEGVVGYVIAEAEPRCALQSSTPVR
jgi:hypothetical protein